MTTSDKDAVRGFVAGHVGEAAFGDQDDLFTERLVSSLFAVQIVMWVERTFGVEVHSDDLDMRNFNSVDAIARFVADRRPVADPAG